MQQLPRLPNAGRHETLSGRLARRTAERVSQRRLHKLAVAAVIGALFASWAGYRLLPADWLPTLEEECAIAVSAYWALAADHAASAIAWLAERMLKRPW